LPADAGAALLIELDGLEAGIDDEAERVRGICMEQGARGCRLARDENERKKLWAARKGAFGAISRIAPDSMIQDAVVPRSRLPEVLRSACLIASKFQLRIANVFHAGDGNLHPLICFDSRSAEQVSRVKEAGRELMDICVRAGGSITGEHGVGLDKRELLPLIFSDDDMDVMLRVRAAFDPPGLMNPGKIIPVLRGCGEGRAVAIALSEPGAIVTGPLQPLAAWALRRSGASLQATVNDAPARHSLSALLSGGAAGPNGQYAGQLSPSSFDELCEAMRESVGRSVIPSGAGTWLEAGNPLTSSDLILKTTRLNRIVEHEPADLIATAQAGVTLEDFNSELAKRGQWLPLDPPDDGRATIGGVVATGLSGPQRIGYGAPRGFVIGMRVVLADGTLIKAGGRVVKNVAGYDLCKLFTGSYGSLGVITEVTFKLRPLPQASRTVLALGSFESLLSGTRALAAAKLFPVALELLSPGFATEAEFSEGDQCLLLVRFSGLHRAVDYQSECAVNMLESHSRIAGPLDDDDAKAWRDLASMPLRLSHRCIWRVSVRSSDLARLLSLIAQAGSDSFSASRIWQASAADGQIRVVESPSIDCDQLVKAIERFRTEAESLGGSLIVENASAEIRSKINSWGNFGKRAKLMMRIKQQLDPGNILSPGRFATTT
jgi:FAD/FMN-containing dehydrogenase